MSSKNGTPQKSPAVPPGEGDSLVLRTPTRITLASASPLKRKKDEDSPTLLGMEVTSSESPKKRRLNSETRRHPAPIARPNFISSQDEQAPNDPEIPVVSYLEEDTPRDPYPIPSDAVMEIFWTEANHLGGFLRRIGESWYAMFVEKVGVDWTLIAFVRDSSTIRKPPILTGMPTLLCTGEFHFCAGAATSAGYYVPRPGPGASVGGKWLNESGTIGGLLRGRKSGKVWAATVGHIGYYMSSDGSTLPTRMEPAELLNINSPSLAKLDSLINLHDERLQGGNLPPAREAALSSTKEDMEKLKNNPNKLYYGDCKHRIWEAIETGEEHKGIKDLALIEMDPERVGTNSFDFGHDFFYPLVDGVGGIRNAEKGESVTVIGMMSGSVPGQISSEGPVYLKEFGSTKFKVRMVNHIDNGTIMKGDSGGWLFDKEGFWVGMNVGGMRGSTTDGGRTFNRSTFVDAEDILSWAIEATGEKVEVIVHA